MIHPAAPTQVGQDPGHGAGAVEIRMISLGRSTARRAIMQAQFDRLRLAHAYEPAVDAFAPENAARMAALPANGPWGRNHPGAMGCTLSHFEALGAFLQGGAPWCLMLEDDVFLADDLSAWLADLSWWPAGADIVKLERWCDDRLLVLVGRDGPRHAGRRLPRLYSRHSGTGGYMVTRAAARMIVDHRPLNMPIDHLLFNPNISPLARRLRIHQVVPALVQQGNDPPAPASAPRPASPRSRRPVGQRLRRGWHEIKVVPRQLWLLATGRARLARIDWQSTIPSNSVTQ